LTFEVFRFLKKPKNLGFFSEPFSSPGIWTGTRYSGSKITACPSSTQWRRLRVKGKLYRVVKFPSYGKMRLSQRICCSLKINLSPLYYIVSLIDCILYMMTCISVHFEFEVQFLYPDQTDVRVNFRLFL